jgi:hypothetical protein
MYFESIDIWDDIAEECTKFGTIVDMKIPRPNKGQNVPGCGLVSTYVYIHIQVIYSFSIDFCKIRNTRPNIRSFTCTCWP